jgi:hypothetical protein
MLFIISTLSLLFLNHSKNTKPEKLMKTLGYVKDKTQIIFKLLVSILLIILFNPRQQNMIEIDTEAKLILYLYGILTIIEYGVEYFK